MLKHEICLDFSILKEPSENFAKTFLHCSMSKKEFDTHCDLGHLKINTREVEVYCCVC